MISNEKLDVASGIARAIRLGAKINLDAFGSVGPTHQAVLPLVEAFDELRGILKVRDKEIERLREDLRGAELLSASLRTATEMMSKMGREREEIGSISSSERRKFLEEIQGMVESRLAGLDADEGRS